VPRPVYSVYDDQHGELFTLPVMFFHSYEVTYRRGRGSEDFDNLVIPVVFENGTLEEEDSSSFIGLSLEEVPSPEDWQRQIKEYHARRR